jgi:predicted O-methyltransferase YrrM
MSLPITSTTRFLILPEKRDWTIYSTPPGCNFDLRKQVDRAWELSSNYQRVLLHERATKALLSLPQRLLRVDAEMAYCMVRHFKPSRIVEIGTGYSTRVLAAALKQNAQRDQIRGKLISVDPFPERFSANGWKDMVVQVRKAVQDLDLGCESGDILFIDSGAVPVTGVPQL